MQKEGELNMFQCAQVVGPFEIVHGYRYNFISFVAFRSNDTKSDSLSLSLSLNY